MEILFTISNGLMAILLVGAVSVYAAFDENPYRDIVGYALLGMNRHLESREGEDDLPEVTLEPLPDSQLM